MDNSTTADWIEKCFQKFTFSKRFLIWDSFRCHLSTQTKTRLKDYNTIVGVIPGGCTKYIQPADVTWNKPLKDKLRQRYEDWMSEDLDKQYTKGGNLKAPSKSLLVDWILDAWDELPSHMIADSFKTCGINNEIDGSEDKKIHCLKEGQPCRGGWDALLRMRESFAEITEISLAEEEDADEEANNLIIIEDSSSNDEA
jgi:DDE superfamily endonuclease